MLKLKLNPQKNQLDYHQSRMKKNKKYKKM